jgi:hypothetical protein
MRVALSHAGRGNRTGFFELCDMLTAELFSASMPIITTDDKNVPSA